MHLADRLVASVSFPFRFSYLSSMNTLTEIQRILRGHAEYLRVHYGVTNLAVFGSVARGEAKPESDVDIVADVPEEMSLLRIISAENYLSKILGMKVDFIPRSDIRSELRDRILSGAVGV